MVRQEAARFVDNAVVGAENRLLRILNGRIFLLVVNISTKKSSPHAKLYRPTVFPKKHLEIEVRSQNYWRLKPIK